MVKNGEQYLYAAGWSFFGMWLERVTTGWGWPHTGNLTPLLLMIGFLGAHQYLRSRTHG